MADLSQIALILGISLPVLIIVLIWTAIWKALALWKSARKNSPVWFVVLLIVNTLGILEILYIFIFSGLGKKPIMKVKETKKPSRKRR